MPNALSESNALSRSPEDTRIPWDFIDPKLTSLDEMIPGENEFADGASGVEIPKPVVRAKATRRRGKRRTLRKRNMPEVKPIQAVGLPTKLGNLCCSYVIGSRTKIRA